MLLAFLFTSVYFSGFVPKADNPNELSRIEAIVAFVEHGTFSIDRTRALFGDTMDKSVAGGHYYSNKAPGLIFAGIPVYRLLRVVLPPPRRGTDGIFVLLRFLTVTLAALAALYRFARRLAESHPETGSAILLAVAFGTPFIYYARSFFSHAWTAALLFLAWDALRRAEETQAPRAANAFLAASGFLASLAAVSEYPAAPIALFLAARAAARRPWNAAPLVAGALAPLALLLVYDAACFGSPWTLSSAREADPGFATTAGRGVFGLGIPSPRTALKVLFHPARGVLLFSPFLLWCLPGAARWARSRVARRDLVFVAASTLVLVGAVCAYPHWEGGWSLGVRYLLPVLLLAAAALPWALAGGGSRRAFAAAAMFSSANFFLLSAVYPHLPDAIPWPAANVSWWVVARGGAAPNAGTTLGLPPVLSLLPPLLALVIAAAAALRGLGEPVLVPALAGLAIFAATLARPPALSDEMGTWRERLLEGLRRVDGARSDRKAPHIIERSP